MIGQIIDCMLDRAMIALFASAVAPQTTPEQNAVIKSIEQFSQLLRNALETIVKVTP